MDKIFSARLDESVVRRIGALAQQLETTKKAVIENAIQVYAEKIEAENDFDVLEQTLGAWRRTQPPQKTVEEARQAFRRSMHRYQK